MAAELVWRGLANGAVIFAIVWVFRRRGQRAAGLLAALPVLSAPALFTLSVDHSPIFAAAAAVAGLRATGLTALLLLLYGLLRRHVGAPWALLISGAATLLVTWLTCGLGHAFEPTLALTTLWVGMAQWFLPRLASVGPICRFLRGYLDGLLVRCTFLAVLVPALVALGGWLAFPLAGLAAIATLAVVTNWRQAPPPQGGPDDPGAGEGGSATTRADRSYVQ